MWMAGSIHIFFSFSIHDSYHNNDKFICIIIALHEVETQELETNIHERPNTNSHSIILSIAECATRVTRASGWTKCAKQLHITRLIVYVPFSQTTRLNYFHVENFMSIHGYMRISKNRLKNLQTPLTVLFISSHSGSTSSAIYKPNIHMHRA